MSNHENPLENHFLTRRQLLGRMGNGFAMLGLASVFGSDVFGCRNEQEYFGVQCRDVARCDG